MGIACQQSSLEGVDGVCAVATGTAMRAASFSEVSKHVGFRRALGKWRFIDVRRLGRSFRLLATSGGEVLSSKAKSGLHGDTRQELLQIRLTSG
jgi:hypothetical protein